MGSTRTRTAIALAAVAAALGITFGAYAATAQTVLVTAGKPSELKFTLSKRTVNKGVVVFRVTNRGMLKHDFKIAGRKTVVLAPGKTSTVRVTFAKAGRFAYLCTVPGHAAGGMKGTLTVR